MTLTSLKNNQKANSLTVIYTISLFTTMIKIDNQ
jgi:hypothetical protein